MASAAFRRFSQILAPAGVLVKNKLYGIGYKNKLAVGGTVTQLTNRTTGVTLDKLTGQITTNNASLAAEAGADFVVTNARVAANDVIVITVKSGVVGAMTLVTVTAVAAGSFTVRVTNNNVAAGVAETGAIVFQFFVLKGVID